MHLWCGPQRIEGVAIADTLSGFGGEAALATGRHSAKPEIVADERPLLADRAENRTQPARDSSRGGDACGAPRPCRLDGGRMNWLRSIADAIPRVVCRPSLIGPTRRPAWRWTRTSRRGPRPRLRPRSANRLVRARRGGSRLPRACHERRGRCHDGTQTIRQIETT